MRTENKGKVKIERARDNVPAQERTTFIRRTTLAESFASAPLAPLPHCPSQRFLAKKATAAAGALHIANLRYAMVQSEEA
ncbi:hypothetical protein ACLOJK_006312 [Asimina triloba]